MFPRKLFFNNVRCKCKADLHQNFTVQNIMTHAMKKVFHCPDCDYYYSKNGNRLDMSYFCFISPQDDNNSKNVN
jgi:hypothetical protein